ncbi:hypothetical protein GCM10027191_18260 [Novilysobacter erysipheiresistens]
MGELRKSGPWMARGPPQGRVSAGGLRGTAARLRERPARCAGPDREAGPDEGLEQLPRRPRPALRNLPKHTLFLAEPSGSPTALD